MKRFSHLDGQGKARMVDVSGKPRVRRTAAARGRVRLAVETVRMIRDEAIRKGDVLAVAKIAGIMAAKRTPELIPLCHGIGLDHVDIDFSVADDGIEIRARTVCTDRTGVEMEALTAVAVAALTVYDMCKAVDSTMRIEAIELVEKTKEDLAAEGREAREGSPGRQQEASPAAESAHARPENDS